MAIRQSQWDSLLTPIIYHHLDIGMKTVPSLRRNLFNVQTSTLAAEKGTGIGGMSPDAFLQYQQSGTKGRLENDQLYTQTYTHVEYPVELRIEKRLMINDQYGQIQKTIQRAGLAAENFMEIQAAGLLNNAFSTSYNWSDGKPLCSTTHPVSPNKASGSYVNKGTSALTADAVSATRIAMMRFKDDRGNEIGVVPDELWCPPELEDAALKIIGSVQDPDSANNAINPQAGRFRVVPWHRLSDTTNWFLASSMWRAQAANWYDRENMEIMLVHESTTELVYELKLHFSYGVDDWRWIYGHEVTGA